MKKLGRHLFIGGASLAAGSAFIAFILIGASLFHALIVAGHPTATSWTILEAAIAFFFPAGLGFFTMLAGMALEYQ